MRVLMLVSETATFKEQVSIPSVSIQDQEHGWSNTSNSELWNSHLISQHTWQMCGEMLGNSFFQCKTHTGGGQLQSEIHQLVVAENSSDLWVIGLFILVSIYSALVSGSDSSGLALWWQDCSPSSPILQCVKSFVQTIGSRPQFFPWMKITQENCTLRVPCSAIFRYWSHMLGSVTWPFHPLPSAITVGEFIL